jgi:PAS domain-containing protein
MSIAKRVLLLLAAMLPTLMVIIAAFLFGASEQLVIASCSAAFISLVVTWFATSGPRRHQEALHKIQDALRNNIEDHAHLVDAWAGANPPRGTMSAVTKELCERLADRRSELKSALHDVTNAVTSLAIPNSDPDFLQPPDCVESEEARLLSSTFYLHCKNFVQLRTRDSAMTTLLKDMPLGVVATDLELKVQYANAAMENLVGLSFTRLQFMCITKLMIEPPQRLLARDVTLPHGMGPDQFYKRLLDNKLRDIVVWLRNAKGQVVPVTVAVRLGEHHVFQFLPLAKPMDDVPESPEKAKQLAVR